MTDAVLEEVREWQNRPLDAVYPVVFFDALRVKIRDVGLVRNKAVYLALGITCQGEKEVLGLWIEQTEGAKFWLKVMNELQTRGVGDILIAVVDGLTGFPDAIAAVFPQTAVQTCIVHLIRNSLAFVSWKDRKKVMPDLRAIYRAETAEAAARLDEFEAGWGERYLAVAPAWRRAWEHVVPMLPPREAFLGGLLAWATACGHFGERGPACLPQILTNALSEAGDLSSVTPAAGAMGVVRRRTVTARGPGLPTPPDVRAGKARGSSSVASSIARAISLLRRMRAVMAAAASRAPARSRSTPSRSRLP